MINKLPAPAISASLFAPVQERSTPSWLFLRICILLFPMFAGAISGFGQFGRYYRDADGDGFGNPNVSTTFLLPGYVQNNTDCNDNSAIEKPGQRWYLDSDNDRYGATGAASVVQCRRPAGYKAGTELIAITGDCNDNDANILLGTFWYPDADGDGFGASGGSTRACTAPSGYVADNTDCNDNSALEKPGQVWYKDNDNDGYGESGWDLPFPIFPITQCNRPEGYKTAGELISTNGDCNDNDPNIKVLLLYQDLDGDGFGNSSVFIESCFTGIVGYSRNSGDCNDNDQNVNPNTLWYRDADGDGFGAFGESTRACTAPSGYVADNTDCNDNSALEKPGQVWYKDSDNDGYGDAGSESPFPIFPITQCSRPGGYKTAGELISTNGDCNDNDPNIKMLLLYQDLDGDGIGNPAVFIESCLSGLVGYSRTSGDCNDNDPNIGQPRLWGPDADGDGFGSAPENPEGPGERSCFPPPGFTGYAYDCNDNSALEKPGQVWYKDSDNDGHGDAGSNSPIPIQPIIQCNRPHGYKTAGELISTNGDCNDNDPNITILLLYEDLDGDGFGNSSVFIALCTGNPAGYSRTGGDCDDNDQNVNPNTLWYLDSDGDGFGAPETAGSPSVRACLAPAGYVGNNTDCDDGNRNLNPNTYWYLDGDGDGFGTDIINALSRIQACLAPSGYVANNTDCDDSNPLINANTIWFPDLDNDGYGGNGPVFTGRCFRPVGYKMASDLISINSDCNDNDPNVNLPTIWYPDADGDGFGAGDASTASQSCLPPPGYVGNNTDCDDNNQNLNPNTFWYRDADGDGFGSSIISPATIAQACLAPSGYVANKTDCDDSNTQINPNTIWYPDLDNDGYGGSGPVSTPRCERPAGYKTAGELTATTGDCNDNDATVTLLRLWYRDADGDGFGNAAVSQQACSASKGYVGNNTDCNDNNALEKPGMRWYKDLDNDGYFDGTDILSCLRPAGYKAFNELISGSIVDCNDNDPAISGPKTWYRDSDGDGFGRSGPGRQEACTMPTGYAGSQDDCNDNDALEKPGQVWYSDMDDDGFGADGVGSITQCGRPSGYKAASELIATTGDCNDNNENINPNTLWYRDDDGDGFGDINNSTRACLVPSGFVSNNTDCNDNSNIEKPGQVWYKDLDNDGVKAGATQRLTQCNRPDGYKLESELISSDDDCDDNNALYARIVLWYGDWDGDGFGSSTSYEQACAAPVGYVANNTDCDDEEEAINPNTPWYKDSDNDRYGAIGVSPVIQCDRPAGYRTAGELINITGDCNDNDDRINIAVLWYLDADRDGFGDPANSVRDCSRPAGYVSTNTDCNDNSAVENPEQEWYKDLDNDGYSESRASTIRQCSRPPGYKAFDKFYNELIGTDDCNDNNPDIIIRESWYPDADGDGFGNSMVGGNRTCFPPSGYVRNNQDCNDNNAIEKPGQVWYKDTDNDGYSDGAFLTQCRRPAGYKAAGELSSVSGDCNDANAALNPGAAEVCNGIDDDCDGNIDEGVTITCYQDLDNDGFGNLLVTTQACNVPSGYVTNSNDCNDGNAALNPAAIEVCNGIDDNCNGLVDDGLVSCIPPVVTAPTLTQPTCVLPTGRIIVKATGPAILQYSINNGASFSNIANFTNLAPGNYFIVVRSTSNPNYLVPYAGNPVVINPVPPLAVPTTIAGPVGVCRNTTEVFSVTPVAGAVSYQWTLPFNATGTSTTNSISVTFNGTFSSGNISVRAINACGQSPLFTRNIEYYGAKPAQPAAITGQTIGLCGTRTYSIASIAKTNNYIWVNPAGTSIISGQGTTSIVLSIGNSFKTGTLSVAAANCKGTSNARTLVLNRNPAVPASITGPIIGVCENSTQAYSCGLVAGATLYTWAVPAGAVINSGQGTNAISVTFPAGFVSGDIKVASGTSCGSGTQRSLSVNSILNIPGAISGPVTVCPNATGIVFSTNAVAGVTYNWTVPSGATITSGQGTPSITVNWGSVAGQVKVTGSNVCGTSGLRNLAVSLLACGAPEITMAKVEESTVVANKLSVQLWPNPARDVLMVTLDEFVPNQKMELTLMQADGKVQTAQSLMPTIKGQQMRMDVSRASAGYYILLIKQTGISINKQVLIVR